MFDSIQMFSIVNHLLVSRKRYSQLFLVRKIYVKMVKKNEKCQNFEKIFSVNSKDVMTWVCLDENMSPEVFWRPYHVYKHITRKKKLHFRRLVKKRRFLTHFLPSTKIFACLVNKCWPKFCHRKKALIFLYTSLTLDFSYLS